MWVPSSKGSDLVNLGRGRNPSSHARAFFPLHFHVCIWGKRTPQGKPKGKFFIPVAGFVVKASLERPWAPLPGASSAGPSGGDGGRKVVENAPAGTKLFINLCGHEGVAPPIDQVRDKTLWQVSPPKRHPVPLCVAPSAECEICRGPLISREPPCGQSG